VGKQQVQGRQMQSRADMASITGFREDMQMIEPHSVRVSQAHCNRGALHIAHSNCTQYRRAEHLHLIQGQACTISRCQAGHPSHRTCTLQP
jgi:hypothetical protein